MLRGKVLEMKCLKCSACGRELKVSEIPLLGFGDGQGDHTVEPCKCTYRFDKESVDAMITSFRAIDKGDTTPIQEIIDEL
jgi:hypothetical protein